MKQSCCFIICTIVFILIYFAIFTGCSRHPFYEAKQNIEINLKKKIGIVQFDNRIKAIEKDTVDTFYGQLVTNMTQMDPSLFFETQDGQPEILETASRLLSTDLIDREALITTARNKGYQALIWARFHDIRIISQKAGIYGFRTEKPFVQFRGEFSLFDCETHTKLWYAPVDQTYRLDTFIQPDKKNTPVLTHLTVEKVLSLLSQFVSSQMVSALEGEHWKGFITTNDKDLYVVSSGKNAGVVNHMTFEVIGSMGTLDGIYNQKYWIPGKPIGRIQIVEVDDSISKAVPLYGNQLEKSICICQ
ncbi:MAG: hypothetical protein OMM_03605 [Candidatus Magnetoglobus multicellularis str. Araruama]|uniref:Lipoprotein n=1 Tax=Candidatus Magnetoglobus multicellularis str. Araruama TaxID=890399 RepID=A0A1V1P565_9BACT|nr:MAG: hypothetical protein OMM_03605 [Candidatus Magnetoglobus multicellularis str. Araruama]